MEVSPEPIYHQWHNMFEFEKTMLAHALEEFPRSEVCGFVVRDAEKGIISVPSKNTADKPGDFRVDALPYLHYLKSGDLLAYYHSHITDEENFTAGDIRDSEETNISCFLVLPEKKVIKVYRPNGFKVPLEGRIYVPHVLDCKTLVLDTLKFEKAIILPDINTTYNDALFGFTKFNEYFDKAKLIMVDKPPQKWDILIMQYKSKRPNHVGVYLGDGHMLHHLANSVSKEEVWSGEWEKNTTHVVRHESLF